MTKQEIMAGRNNVRGARNPYQEQIDDTENGAVTEIALAQNAIDRLLFESYEPTHSRGILWSISLPSESDIDTLCALYIRGGWTVTRHREQAQLYISW